MQILSVNVLTSRYNDSSESNSSKLDDSQITSEAQLDGNFSRLTSSVH